MPPHWSPATGLPGDGQLWRGQRALPVASSHFGAVCSYFLDRSVFLLRAQAQTAGPPRASVRGCVCGVHAVGSVCHSGNHPVTSPNMGDRDPFTTSKEQGRVWFPQESFPQSRSKWELRVRAQSPGQVLFIQGLLYEMIRPEGASALWENHASLAGPAEAWQVRAPVAGRVARAHLRGAGWEDTPRWLRSS